MSTAAVEGEIKGSVATFNAAMVSNDLHAIRRCITEARRLPPTNGSPTSIAKRVDGGAAP